MPRPQRHPGRKRRLAGWLLLFLTMALAGVWAASGWTDAIFQGRQNSLYLANGRIVFVRFTAVRFDTPSTGWGWHSGPVATVDPRFHWSIPDADASRGEAPPSWNVGIAAYRCDPGRFSRTEICLWPLALPGCGALVAVLWRGAIARRMSKIGLCQTCGYDKRGLMPGAVCPECGK